MNPDLNADVATTPFDELFNFKPVGAPNYALLREARDMIAQLPERQIDLICIIGERGESSHGVGSIATDGDLDAGCGTVACAAGWLALTPRFQALGLAAVPASRGTGYALAYKGADTRVQSNYDLATAPLFNITLTQAQKLFASRGENRMDVEMYEDDSDQAVFLARIDALLDAETPAE